MPLLPTVLCQDLARALSTSAPSHGAAAAKLAAAYARYAAGATAGAFPWVPTGQEEARLRRALAAALGPSGAPPIVGAAWVLGLTQFWLLPPVPFAPGLVTAMPGAVALAPAITTALLNPRNTSGAAAASLASALDAATRTVLVTIPPSGPVPLV